MSVQPENGAIDALRVEHIAKSFGLSRPCAM